MHIEAIPQIELGNISRLRVGDVLNRIIADSSYQRFRFAVAYMRLSGLDRLGASIDGLLNRNGHISGAIGVDDHVTSIEALESLSAVSSDSTIFYTTSSFIYHPKLYLLNGDKQAVAVIGSANLTSDGLFRNIEVATAIHLNLESKADLEIYEQYDIFMNELLDTSYPNVQPLSDNVLRTLTSEEIIGSEAQTPEPGSPIRRPKKKSQSSANIEMLFPRLYVPVAPPGRKINRETTRRKSSTTISSRSVGVIGTFIMRLSAFDSSHRSGTKGTPEVLIPQDAMKFFPPLAPSGRKHPDTFFDVVLNTNTGRERHGYRLWYYGDRIEYRLRMDNATIDLSTPNGGDLLIINKLASPLDKDLLYEVTLLPPSDPTFNTFLSMCTQESQGKKWGFIDI